MFKFIMKSVIGAVVMFSTVFVLSACINSNDSTVNAYDEKPKAVKIAKSPLTNIYRYTDCKNKTVLYMYSDAIATDRASTEILKSDCAYETN